ncbi:type II secretion system protein, partial [Clostridium tarantellae]
MRKKKKAFTLIEMIMYLSICSLIFLSISISMNFIQTFKEKLNIIEIKDSIHNFLIESKFLCKEENMDAEIYI